MYAICVNTVTNVVRIANCFSEGSQSVHRLRAEEEEVRESRPEFGSYLSACINGPDWNIMPISLFSTVTKTNLAIAVCAMKTIPGTGYFFLTLFYT